MPEAPSLIIATPRQSMARLRGESGARALAIAEDAAREQGRVRWIPLGDGEPASRSEGSDAAWGVRLRSIASSPPAPAVMLWVAKAPGEAEQFLGALASLGDRMLRSLQRDRVPPRVAAIVYVAEAGINEADAKAMETMACAGRNWPAGCDAMPAGLREVLGRRGRPVYLMNRRTRVGADGTSWDVRDVWPVEVGRLLASLEGANLRQPGVRAWRSFRFNPTRYPFERIEVEAFRFAREALGAATDDGAAVREGTGRQAPVSRAPGSSVATDRSPQHCMDGFHRASERLILPDWWELEDGGAASSVLVRTDTSGETGRPGSRWHQRFVERGRVFVDDRRERSLESVDETIGPKSIGVRAWSAIHDDLTMANWFASGQFYAGPDPAIDGPGDGLQGWRDMSARERRVIDSRARAMAEAREVDLARAHFIGMRWRIASAVAASLFISTVFSSLFTGTGWRWPVAMAAAASAGAAIASFVVLWMEALAGRRGRAAVEESAQEAEAAIAESFHARMRLGAEGERLGRRRRWFQTAARTRDGASRLKAIVDIAEIHALRCAAADAPSVPSSARAYSAATSIEVSAAALPVESLRRALREDPSGIVFLRRRQHEAWWSDALRREDPLQRGAVLARTFAPRATQAIVDLVDGFRADLLRVVERTGSSVDFGWVADGQVARLLGPPGDLRNLGVQTQRSVGREQMRNVWVHVPIDRHARHAAEGLAVHLGHSVAAQANVSAVDRWGCMGLLVDEVAVGFRSGRSGVMCIELDGTVCIWEGADPAGPVADAGARLQ